MTFIIVSECVSGWLAGWLAGKGFGSWVLAFSCWPGDK